MNNKSLGVTGPSRSVIAERSRTKFIVIVVAVAVFNLGIPRTRAMVQRPSLKTESQVKSEAGLYDTAIREISRIEAMKLTTAAEFARVKELLERHVPNLRFNRAKLVALALGDSTFIGAAKARAATKESANGFAKELAADAQSIFRLSGGAAVRDRISQSFKADISLLQRVSEKIRRASAEFKEQSPAHHAHTKPLLSGGPEYGFQRISLKDTLTVIVLASLLVSAAMLVGPLLAVELYVMAGLVVVVGGGNLVLAGALLLTQKAVTNIGSEEGRDKIAECMKGVDAKYHSCEANNPLYAAIGGCLAEWLLNAAACLVVE